MQTRDPFNRAPNFHQHWEEYERADQRFVCFHTGRIDAKNGRKRRSILHLDFDLRLCYSRGYNQQQQKA